MATKKPATPATWLELKCTKYTPEETLDWVLNAWSKTVKPEFAKFRKAIADQTADIPPAFFETKGAAHGNRNPLFLFLRPKKLLYIALASAQGKASQKKQNSLEKILTDYRIEWDSSLTELQTRLNHISAVSQSRHLIQQLCEQIYCLGDIGGINSDWHDRYKDHYLQTCEAFSDIPWQVANSNSNSTRGHSLEATDEDSDKLISAETWTTKAEIKLELKAKHFGWSKQQKAAFKASTLCKPIVLSDYAKKLGVVCDQKNGIFSMKGLKHPLSVRKGSTIAWMILRLLATSDDPYGWTQLYVGWNGAFSGYDESKNFIRDNLIEAETSDKFNNHCVYHLTHPRFRSKNAMP